MVICVGEILVDMAGVRQGRRMQIECFAGGAPFNVACCLKKLDCRCGFCGCVGKDAVGDFLSEIAEKQNFDYLRIERDNERNTTLAFVNVDAAGERKFSFYRKNTADAYLPQGAVEEIVRLADIIHIGSLPISSESGRTFLDELIRNAHEKEKKVSFDVNYRSDIFESEAEATELYQKYIEQADIVKFSEEELYLFSRGNSVEEMLTNVAGTHKTVLLTLGSCGSMVCANGSLNYVPAEKIDTVADTNGAGDAFMAGALSSIEAGLTDWNMILRRANRCGALAVSQRGAYPEWGVSDITM